MEMGNPTTSRCAPSRSQANSSSYGERAKMKLFQTYIDPRVPDLQEDFMERHLESEYRRQSLPS
jgi:hypothetical protein